MKWMTQAQRETFLAIAALSPGRSRPWLTAEEILKKRLNGETLSNRQMSSKLDWVRLYLGMWSVPGAFMETQLLKNGRKYRLNKKGKHVATYGDLP